MKHLIMVGACYIDTILSIPHFPQEDAKLRASTIRTRRGGNGGNSLEVLQQLLSQSSSPLALHLITTLPGRNAPAAAQVISSFRGDGVRVDCSRCLFREDQTECASSYILHSQATGSRTIVNHNGLAEMTLEEFVAVADEFGGEETWWHFEGRIPETTLECIQHLRAHHPRAGISVEVEKPGRKGLRDLAREADVVFYSRSWAEGEGYANAEACLTGEVASTPSASLLLCTWGARGACAMSPQGTASRETFHVEPTEKGVHVVDAVGAGDTFIAGVLHGVLCRDEKKKEDEEEAVDTLRQTVRFAVNLATAKVQQNGFAGLDLSAAATTG